MIIEGGLLPGFDLVCVIRADLNHLSGALRQCVGLQGAYWIMEFNICVRFGGTELEAFLEWKEHVRLLF